MPAGVFIGGRLFKYAHDIRFNFLFIRQIVFSFKECPPFLFLSGIEVIEQKGKFLPDAAPCVRALMLLERFNSLGQKALKNMIRLPAHCFFSRVAQHGRRTLQQNLFIVIQFRFEHLRRPFSADDRR